MRRHGTLIVVLAKAPRPGYVKTRLAEAIGPVEAARLHARLVERTLACARAARCATVELHASPAGHDALHALARRYGVRLRGQAPGDVGDRMHAAFRQALRRYSGVILVGSDCPVLMPADLRRAARLLRSCDAVIAPAEDGGYPLLALSRVSSRLFSGIAWSTDEVLGQTRERLASLGWRWRELRTLWDVDRVEDFERFRAARLPERWP